MKFIFSQFPCTDMTNEEFLTLFHSWDKSVEAAKESLEANLCTIFVTNRCLSAMMKIKQMVDDGIEFVKEKKREQKILNKKTPKQIRTANRKKQLAIDKKKKQQRTKRNLDFVTVITEEFSFIFTYIVHKFQYICEFA